MNGDQLKFFVETVQHLSLARDLNSIMAVVRTAARKLTGADGATFILRDRNLCYYADEDAISPLWKGQRFPMTSCISGWAMLNRQPAIIEDIYSDDRIPIEAYRPTFVKSLVMVPIRTVNPIGAIGNYWASNHQPTSTQVLLLQALADITSVSIENYYAFDELETFIYKLSHDIRGPIARILGLISIANMDNSISVKEFYNAIGKQAERLDGILKSLVETINIRKADNVYYAIKFDQIVEESLKPLKNMEGFDKIKIEHQILCNKDFHSNKSLLVSMFQNLIENAINYRKEKSNDSYVKILIAEENNGVKIKISDNGIGIAKYVHKDIFKMFFRGTSQSTGSGLGLYLVNQIIKQLDGEISIDSEELKGTTFNIYLPNKGMINI